jgi:Sec-independent protein translocase protein TatA
MWEFALIILVALILLGPRQLTETAKVVGRLYRELQRLTSEVKDTINLESITTPSPTTYEPPPPKTDLPRPTRTDQDLVPPPGEKSGPDFYAELLEQSVESTDTGELTREEKERIQKDHGIEDGDQNKKVAQAGDKVTP